MDLFWWFPEQIKFLMSGKDFLPQLRLLGFRISGLALKPGLATY